MDGRLINKNRRIFYILLPLLLLTLLFVGSNLFSRGFRADGLEISASLQETAVTPPPSSNTPNLTTATATPSPSVPIETLTSTPPIIPTIKPGATVTLFGPPEESSFTKGEPVSFYWAWTGNMSDEFVFTLLVENENGARFISHITEPNLGESYQFQLIPEQVLPESGSYRWQVRLETAVTKNILSQSNWRTINFTD